jgi:hypothetical protein
VIDDSHNYDKPMELILGKKFKFEVWEACLKSMRLQEVSEFVVKDKVINSSVYASGVAKSIFRISQVVLQPERTRGNFQEFTNKYHMDYLRNASDTDKN